ncbi:MAG: SWIM zinc finger family protein [Candidatus Kapaibacterium sp.]
MKDFNNWRFKPSRHREPGGGIKSRSQRGAFGTSWWAKRWISVLERFDLGPRLARGRAYARGGRVLSIAIEKGIVTAKVQGSHAYNVWIEVKTLSPEQWDTLAKALSEQAIFAAQLLAGEMPDDIETVFHDTGIPLFPANVRDLETDCTCPDWSNPCKHIAAVYYLLGEEFDRDPFLIFKLRGMEREELITRLAPAGETGTSAEDQPAMPPEPLRADPSLFWGTDSYADPEPAELRTPPVSAALVRQLGAFPFWRGKEALEESLVKVYERVGTMLRDPQDGATEAEIISED